MVRVLFVCHGNICRSPMAECVFRHLVRMRADEFFVASAGVSDEEHGNPIYPPVCRLLREQGIDYPRRSARRVVAADYRQYDYIIGMSSRHCAVMTRMFGGDPQRKVSRLLDYVAADNAKFYGRDVADPWYTGDYQTAYDDIVVGCEALLRSIDRR